MRATALYAAALFALASQPHDLTVDAPPSLAGVAARIQAMAPGPLARTLSHAGLALPPQVRVILVASGDERARQIPSWIVGRAIGADTIVIFPERIGSYPYESLDAVVLHELVHLALALRAGGRPLPRWFHEGVAVSVEAGWGFGSQVRLLVAAARDPGIDDLSALFASADLPDTTAAYLLSAALVDDIRRRHGPAIPGTIAARVADGLPFEEAFASVTGESVEHAAARAWRVYRGIRWLPIVTSASALWGAIVLLAAVAFVVRARRRHRRRRQWEAEERQSAVANDSDQAIDDAN